MDKDKNGDKLELQTLLSGDGDEDEDKQNIARKKEKEPTAFGEDEPFMRWRKAALYISCVSIVFTTAFGGTFFVFSQIAGSPAAFGFALAAVLDSFSSMVVLWRFSTRESQGSNSLERETRACIAIAVCFILSAFAIAAKAVYTLVKDRIPTKEFLMEMLSIGSCLFLIFLTSFKCLIADKVHSRAMRTDAINSLAGAFMTLGMIASDVVCDNNPNICYLDSVTAILIAIALFSYGVMTIIELTACEDKKPRD
ncbi:hypothetical protein OS493_034180 [Desmophyllum pertusum]|uniref:Transmembrane protein 163 n=1 Tax=Desmophyllum pertusum TaxID=174260 RepID=A0A9W9ZWZ3_9CNID|nr:hypothetical protein OS493_034180 [Desmophyllum pertusum]